MPVMVFALGPLVLVFFLVDVIILRLLRRHQRRSGLIRFDQPALRKSMRDGWHGGRC